MYRPSRVNTVTEPVESSHAAELNAKVWQDVEGFVHRFQRVEVPEEGGKEGAEKAGDEAADDEDNSGLVA